MFKSLICPFMGMMLLLNPLFAQTPRMGLKFDDAGYKKMPARGVHRGAATIAISTSLKPFAPSVLHQGDLSTCAAISFATALTIQEARLRKQTNPQEVQKLLFSPAYLYAASKAIEDTDCKGGLTIHKVIEGMSEYGLVRQSVVGNACIEMIDPKWIASAFKKGLPLFNRFELSQFEMRRALSDGNPVVVAVNGTILGKSFFELHKDLWDVEDNSGNPNLGHCMVVIGYDNNKYGGAFEVMNSYGTNWGSNGYAWIKYDDLLKNIRYAIEVPPLTELPNFVSKDSSTVPKITPPLVVNKFEGRLRLTDGKNKTLAVMAAEQALNADKRGAGTRPKTKNSHFTAVQPVKEGTEYQVIMKNSEPCYVYIFNYDSRNVADILFPKDTVSPYMGAQDEVVLPNKNTVIAFDANKGTDYSCILFSKAPIDMADLKNQLEKLGTGTFLERLEQVLGDKLATTKAGQVRYGLSEGDLKLETLSDKTIMPLIIEFEHQ
jgi:Domain of unknown function (DUF4384)/Papain family cysteine protease